MHILLLLLNLTWLEQLIGLYIFPYFSGSEDEVMNSGVGEKLTKPGGAIFECLKINGNWANQQEKREQQ